MSKNLWKLQDLGAPPGCVHCARLGEKSGQVWASGGDDKNVSLWKVGKPHAMMSLSGHASDVESLVFDRQEEVLVVGCAGGTVHAWDLEYRKMAGTFFGHRTSCNTVEFHPYGDFFASGSADTSLKIWDLRGKSCMQTYRGHSGAISSVRFSPHGRWVVTGGDDNQVKIWDITAGKLMRDLDQHTSPITCMAFHPKEFLLATGSADRTVKLWNLESFNLVGTTDLGSSSVRAVKFYVEEQSLLSASHSAIRIFPIDGLCTPGVTIEADWSGLLDMRLCLPEKKIISICTEGPRLGIWVVDLQKNDGACINPTAGNYSKQAGQPSVSSPSMERRDVAQHLFGNGEGTSDVAGRLVRSEKPPQRLPQSAPSSKRAADNKVVGRPVGGSASGFHNVARPHREHLESQLPRRCTSPKLRGNVAPRHLHGSGPSPAPDRVSPSRTSNLDELRTGEANGILVNPMSKQTSQTPVLDTSAEQVSKASPQHAEMMCILHRRLSKIRHLKQLWSQGNLDTFREVLHFPQDHAIVCDFALSVMKENLVAALSLDSCMALLPIMSDLTRSRHDNFAMAGYQFADLLLHHFGDLICETRMNCSKKPSRQLDLAQEERLRKCNACHNQLCEIHKSLQGIQASQLPSRLVSFRKSLHAFLQRC